MIRMAEQSSRGNFFRSLAIIVISLMVIGVAFRLVEAGSLTPSATPASTMNSLEDAYNALVGTFDSSSITKDLNGSALEVSRCIITQIDGGTCP